MKVTVSVLKADIGSIGGHITPSRVVVEEVRNSVRDKGKDFIIDSYIGFTGDDIVILCTHERGILDEKIHKMAWDAFVVGTEVAKKEGLYGTAQDLLKDALSRNVKSMGPAVAEMEFKERSNESFIFFALNDIEPLAWNLPLYFLFAEPIYAEVHTMNQQMNKGFCFHIQGIDSIGISKIIELNAPKDLHRIAALLRDNNKYLIKRIDSRTTRHQAAIGSYMGNNLGARNYNEKINALTLVRIEDEFPNLGELLSAFLGDYEITNSSYDGRIIDDKPLNIVIPYEERCPMISGAGFCVRNGKLNRYVNIFPPPICCHESNYLDYNKALSTHRKFKWKYGKNVYQHSMQLSKYIKKVWTKDGWTAKLLLFKEIIEEFARWAA